MDIAHSVSILAVGTELTDGQVLNRNAQWLSQRVTEMGFRVVLHETVPDDRRAISEAFDRLAAQSKTMFVTGGLGPTTDDFTREVIAEWTGKALLWNEEAWTWIVERLSRLGIVIADSNRQQCYFPKGAETFSNAEGTAAGFGVEHRGSRLFVLPGPPRELEVIWNNHLENRLRSLAPQTRRKELFLWRCIGKSESALGEIVERALEGSGLEIGYRAHMPYIEIKVWCDTSAVEAAKSWFVRLENEIRPWLVTSGTDDICELFLGLLATRANIEIHDWATEGVLALRLGNATHSHPNLRIETLIPGQMLETSRGPRKIESQNGALVLTLEAPNSSSQWCWTLSLGSQTHSQIETLPYRTEGLRNRYKPQIADLALFRWYTVLQGLAPFSER